MQSKFRIVFAISLLTITVDLGIKTYIHSNFAVTESISVIPNFFNLTYVRNPGAAFGFLAQSPEMFRKIFFAVMPLVACLIIFRWLINLSIRDRSQIYALSLIMGGAIGNYLNRMGLGYVVDFLDFHFFYKYHWPAFNVADIAIVCGVGTLIFVLFVEEKARKQMPSANGSSGS